jgi:hypothetical protein
MSEAPTGDLKPDVEVTQAEQAATTTAASETQAQAADTSAATTTDAAATATADAGTAKEQPAPTWPDDWREQLAGGDEAFLRQLKRYSSPTTFAKGWKEREDLIRSGKVKRDAPDPSDAKAMAEWRKEQGLPDDATGYKMPEIKGAEWSDEDKPIVAQFFEHAHKHNLPQPAVDAALTFYKQLEQQAYEARKAADKAAEEAADAALYQEFGREHKTNLTLAARYLSDIPGVGQKWADFRREDGTLLGNDIEFVKWAADQGRRHFGDVTFTSGDAEHRHSSRKAEIEAIMNEDMSRYTDEMAAEYRKILETEAKRIR